MSKTPTIFVVIPTAGRPDLLARTLASLAECDLPESYGETIVMENGPKCGVEDVVCRCDSALQARYMWQAKPNKSIALNTVLSQLDDCLVFFTDDDVRFSPGVLRAYADAAARVGLRHVFDNPAKERPTMWICRDALFSKGPGYVS